jgi:hypothetical protein
MHVSPQAFPLVQILQQYCCCMREPKGAIGEDLGKSCADARCVSARVMGESKLVAARIAIIVFMVRTLVMGTQSAQQIPFQRGTM